MPESSQVKITISDKMFNDILEIADHFGFNMADLCKQPLVDWYKSPQFRQLQLRVRADKGLRGELEGLRQELGQFGDAKARELAKRVGRIQDRLEE